MKIYLEMALSDNSIELKYQILSARYLFDGNLSVISSTFIENYNKRNSKYSVSDMES